MAIRLGQTDLVVNFAPTQVPLGTKCKEYQMFLETELAHLIEDVRREMKLEGKENPSLIAPRSRLIARRFGLDGGGVTEAKALTEEFAIPGANKGPWARISEVCRPFEEYLQHTHENRELPTLDRALFLVSDILPILAQEAEARLVEGGIAKAAFRLDGLVKVAGMLHRSHDLVLRNVGAARFVLPKEHPSLLKQVRDVAVAVVQHAGWARLDFVVSRAQEHLPVPVSSTFVRSVLEAQNDFSWLQPDEGVFWLKDVIGNRLLKQIEKVLGVARNITLPALQVAVDRHNWKHEANKDAKAFGLPAFACPSLPLLQAFCVQIQGLVCVGDQVRAEGIFPSAKDVLDGPERLLFDLLRDGPLTVLDCKRRFLDQHYKPKVLETYLSRSPIVQRLSNDRVGLIGHQ